MKICQIPGFGKAFFKTFGGRILLGHCSGELKNTSQEDKDYYTRYYADCAKYKGFVSSTYSSLINCILNTKEDTEGYKSVNAQNIPVRVVWGTDDHTMPYYQIERMKEILPNAEYITLEDSGHDFVYDEGDKAADAVIPFFKK